MKLFYFLIAFLASASSIAFAYDPSPLQDFCVAINDTKTGGIIYIFSSFFQLLLVIIINLLSLYFQYYSFREWKILQRP